MSVFGDDYSRYYELLYRDKDYEGEARFVKELLDRHAPGAGSILELGCGGGKHAALLAGLGLSVHGVDRSADMLKEAEKRKAALDPDTAGRLEWSEGDVRSVRVGRLFDAVISLFHVVSYLPSNDDLRDAFATASAHLKPGGVFLFDCWYGPTVLSEPPEVRVKRMEDDRTRVVRVCEPEMLPNENGVLVNYTVFIEDKGTGEIRELRESHRMRYLFTPEVEALFSASGMKPLASGEWVTDRPAGLDTFGVYFTGEKTPSS